MSPKEITGLMFFGGALANFGNAAAVAFLHANGLALLASGIVSYGLAIWALRRRSA